MMEATRNDFERRWRPISACDRDRISKTLCCPGGRWAISMNRKILLGLGPLGFAAAAGGVAEAQTKRTPSSATPAPR